MLNDAKFGTIIEYPRSWKQTIMVEGRASPQHLKHGIEKGEPPSTTVYRAEDPHDHHITKVAHRPNTATRNNRAAQASSAQVHMIIGAWPYEGMPGT